MMNKKMKANAKALPGMAKGAAAKKGPLAKNAGAKAKAAAMKAGKGSYAKGGMAKKK